MKKGLPRFAKACVIELWHLFGLGNLFIFSGTYDISHGNGMRNLLSNIAYPVPDSNPLPMAVVRGGKQSVARPKNVRPLSCRGCSSVGVAMETTCSLKVISWFPKKMFLLVNNLSKFDIHFLKKFQQ